MQDADALTPVALDLSWSWNHSADEIWKLPATGRGHGRRTHCAQNRSLETAHSSRNSSPSVDATAARRLVARIS
jgi:hypothetical protein